MDIIIKRFLILVITLAGLQLHAQTNQQMFNRANQFYQDANYDQAVSLYKSILERGFESGELYFNLGNCYYKLDQTGPARLYYEKAARFLKNDEGLENNIALLKLHLVDQIETPPKFILTQLWNDFLEYFTIEFLIWLVAVLFVLMVLSFASHLYFSRQKQNFRFKIYIYIFLTAFLLFTTISIQKIYALETEEYGVVLSSAVTVYAAPSESDTEVFILHEGTKALILRQKSDWLEIKLEDGKSGWLKKSNIEII